MLVRRLRYAAPQWQRRAERGAAAGAGSGSRTRASTASTGTGRADEHPAPRRPPDTVRLLAPFDPVVWDRRRFELLWGWAYRFEAYTPAAKRKLGYYALPLLWRDRVIGWGNLVGEERRAAVRTSATSMGARRANARSSASSRRSWREWKGF